MIYQLINLFDVFCVYRPVILSCLFRGFWLIHITVNKSQNTLKSNVKYQISDLIPGENFELYVMCITKHKWIGKYGKHERKYNILKQTQRVDETTKIINSKFCNIFE
jgi:hypothetical protein